MAIKNHDGTITHEGAVLKVDVQRNYQVMSDVWDDLTYALVWNGERTERVHLYFTETPRDHRDFAEVDATPEVRAAYDAYIARLDAERKAREEAERIERLRREAREPRKGREAVVVRGRKVAKGTRGLIIWHGAGHYGDRVGLKDASGEVHWTAAKNVEAVPFCEACGD